MRKFKTTWLVLPFLLVSINSQAQAIDYDSLIDVGSARNGSKCRTDAPYAPAVEAAFQAFERDWIKWSGGKPTIDSYRYYKAKLLQGEDKIYAPYVSHFSGVVQTYVKTAMKQTTEQLLNRSKTKNILIGDSLMAMYRGYSDKNKPKWDKRTYNAGIYGDTIDMLAARARWNIEIFRPEKVVISISGNNILSGCLIDQYNQLGENVVDTVRRFGERLRAAGVQQVYFINVPPVGFRYTHDSIVAYNARYGSSLGNGIFVLDQYSAFVTPDGQKAAWSYSNILDPVHLSDLAYKLVWQPVMDAIL